MTDYVMGIDGGGSGVRVVIVTPELAICGQSEGPTANPSIVGTGTAAATIRAAMRAALDAAGLAADQIAAVGIGVAGAAAHHSAGWLREVVAAIAPQARIVPSADYEIALVGALGKREGVLILAGTGSLAYGVNAAGQSALAGGWGYLLDDAGGGYWIGIRALQAVARAADGRGPTTALAPALLGALGLHDALDLIPWLYRADAPRTSEVARLAPLVLEGAEAGDPVAQGILARAVDELALAARAVMRRLEMDAPPLAFAGGLLTGDTPLSRHLCAALGLASPPVPRHSPAVGAALLARLAR